MATRHSTSIAEKKTTKFVAEVEVFVRQAGRGEGATCGAVAEEGEGAT
jgi:ribosomal protein S11